MITLNTKLFLSLLAVLILTIIPLPMTINMYRPTWVMVLVIYIQCCLPAYFRVTWVFLLGIILDVLCAKVIGQHSLALIITTWAATARSSNFNYFSTLQQMSIILSLGCLYNLVVYLVDAFFGIGGNVFAAISSACISVMVWPCLRYLFSMPLEAEYQSR